MSGFYSEDYELSRELISTVDMVPSTAKRIAGKWAATKIRKQMKRAEELALWDQFYLLGNIARDFERGDL